MPIGFLNPALLLGLLGAGMPVLVHLLGRRHARRRAFAAFDFLLQSEKRLAARRRVRHLLLLLTRIALLIAVVVAIARPLFRGGTVTGTGQPVSVIALLDRTASMAAVVGDGSAFEHARQLLIDSLRRLPSGSEVGVVSVEFRPRRLTDGFVSIDEAIAHLKQVKQGWSAGSVGRAITEAVALSGAARRPTTTLYIASDLQRTTWTGVDADRAQLSNMQMLVLDAVGGPFPADVALTHADIAGDDQAVTVRASSSPAADRGETGPSRHHVVSLAVDGVLQNRGVVDLAAGGTASLKLALAATPATSAIVAEVAIADGGSLASNDRRYLYVTPPQVVRVLLADGAPSANLYQDEVFYLEQALLADGEGLRIVVQDVSNGTIPGLDVADVIVLANVAGLDPSSRRQLAARVQSGVGLLIAVGENVTPASLSEDLGSLLPAAATGLAGNRGAETSLNLLHGGAETHPVVAPFGSSIAGKSLASARFTHLLAVTPTPDGQVVLGFQDGHPALVETQRGAGRVMLWTSTLDRGWNDLAIKPAFVPLLARIVRYLGGALDETRVRGRIVGEPAKIDLLPRDKLADGPVSFRGPDGIVLHASLIDADHLAVDDFAPQPGAYRCFVGERRDPRFDFVANLAAEESDLERVSSALIQDEMGLSAEVTASGSGEAHREDEAVLPLLVLAVLALLAETLLGRPRSSTMETTGAVGR